MKTTKKIYTTKNDSTNKAHIVQLKNNRNAALKPLGNKFTWLEKMLKSFSDKELKEYILNRICINNSNDINNTDDLNDSNDTNNTNNLNDSKDTNELNGITNTNDSNK